MRKPGLCFALHQPSATVRDVVVVVLLLLLCSLVFVLVGVFSKRFFIVLDQLLDGVLLRCDCLTQCFYFALYFPELLGGFGGCSFRFPAAGF